MRKNVKKIALHAAGLAAIAAIAFASLGGNGTGTAHADPAKPGQHLTKAAPGAIASPTLQEGARGEAVKDLQRRLNKHGHRLDVDGIYGPLTKAAVQDLQRKHRLDVDGIAGPRTWAALKDTKNKPAPAPSTKPGTRGYQLQFTKNQQNPMWSKLSLVHDGKVVKSYRAGSGLGVTNECASGEGWLPNGTYQIKGHATNRDGIAINGYAIQLEDKNCTPKPGQNPVKRTDMFIHSEMLANGSQAIDVPFKDDDVWRWNGDMDYKSNGCIKLTPADIKDLFARLDQAHWPTNLTLRVS
ncbi:peptidoglycan-binding domain-containing protein [Streptomyces toxytricini]|uniref:peptidoglycan-binding domain-containing protein n=1 Tax=Streptomyces toxytricini TaxID=67369 RepID=UPI00342140FC